MLVHGQGVVRTMVHVLIPRVAHHVRYVSRPGPQPAVRRDCYIVSHSVYPTGSLSENREHKAKIILAAVPDGLTTRSPFSRATLTLSLVEIKCQ
jgi:hypothetical protein